ncbi:dihydrofolate reductase family protein [Alkalibacterium putridalgicola]|uniref:dihydrofolate reductase family protein n=1 Tax=Alkalibacterium putridalgicola TaxID=426703 RepID=UPI0034CD5840
MAERKVVLFIASSLDGYIADENESLEWLFSVEGEGDNGYADFYETVDTVVMGNRTYKWLLDQNLEEFPYENKACYVFSRTTKENNKNVEFIDQDIKSFVEELKEKRGRNIWLVGGGDLLRSFLENQLIDEMIVTVAPRMLGKGTPLFKQSDYTYELLLKSVQTFNQFVELHYTIL